MPKRILAMVIYTFALVSLSLVATMDDGMDSADVRDEFFGIEPEQPPMDRGMPDRDGRPMGGHVDRMMSDLRAGAGPRMESEFPPEPMPETMGQDGQMPPLMEKAPRYDHDATPDEIEKMIPVMVDVDISIFDVGFVKDAIEYARENGMEDEAELLSKKLAEALSAIRTANIIGSMDTRASGMDNEDVDEDDIVIVEDVEDDEVPEVIPESNDFIDFSFKPVSAQPVTVCIQLDL